MTKLKFKSQSLEETLKFASALAQKMKPGSVLALSGDLGAGKTSFVQGVAAGLGIPENITVSSPTYVLIHEYPKGALPLYHFDFYRLRNKTEALELNLEEYFEGAGVSVVEWADRFPELFPERTQWIRLKWVDENTREIEC